MFSFVVVALISCTYLAATGGAVDPAAIYDAGYNGTDVLLRIGNGGAGQSGLVGGEKNLLLYEPRP